MRKTNEHYCTRPLNCPYCDSTNIEKPSIGGPTVWSPDYIEHPVSCGDCKGRWRQQYQLTGYHAGSDEQPPLAADGTFQHVGTVTDKVLGDVKAAMEAHRNGKHYSCGVCGSGNIGWDAWVGQDNEIVGGPYDENQCMDCGSSDLKERTE